MNNLQFPRLCTYIHRSMNHLPFKKSTTICKLSHNLRLIFSLSFLLLQNQMEATNCCWFGTVGWSRQLCCISKTLRWSTIHWFLAVSRSRSTRCATIGSRYVLSSSCCGSGTTETASISTVSGRTCTRLAGWPTGTQCTVPTSVGIQFTVILE